MLLVGGVNYGILKRGVRGSWERHIEEREEREEQPDRVEMFEREVCCSVSVMVER